MPTTRRKTHGPASRGAQSTLSFGSRAKVTKPSSSTTHASKAKSLESSVHAEVEPEDVQASSTLPEAPTVAELGPTKVEVVAAEQAKAEIETKPIRTKEVEEAESIGYKRLRSYWRGREDERKAPRVHQQGLSMNEKILRHFDLSSQYGPCVGIARLKRWNRANALGLHPPIEVLAVLLKEDAAGNATSERAYVDELLSTRFAIEENR